jgi:hypothetical protein
MRAKRRANVGIRDNEAFGQQIARMRSRIGNLCNR